MDIIICAERISRYLKGKYVRRSEGGVTRIQDSGGVFSRNKERIWERR